ncbi:uncharacterized protein LOC115885627 isoform X2 [Sitophilus oryzae]|nr:uncharacterized protein LOC115885627 isoform X2 [Sitophilus oryzae]
MVGQKSHKKIKKPLQTTLGKASKPPDQNDFSHLRKPIETSVNSITQVVSLLENATAEVKNFVMYECDIMYECRTCRTIFRSIANFILHKRNFCKDLFNPLVYRNNNINTYQEKIQCNNEETIPSTKETQPSLEKIVDKLRKRDQLRQEANKIFVADLTNDPDSGKIKNMDDREVIGSNLNDIILEKIDTNNSGVFQTVLRRSSDSDISDKDKVESIKTEIMENHKIIENDVPMLNSKGYVCGVTNCKGDQIEIYPNYTLNCEQCTQKFSTHKSLTNHIKSVHNPSRLVYLCPLCKDGFANPWCVYRHLSKVHRTSNKQIRRMRDQINNSFISRGEMESIYKKKSVESSGESVNSENQWINNIEEDNAFQMCAGCGKRFERKAALHSHSKMCAKRLEVCNSINENAKKKEEEEKAKQDKLSKEKELLRGASKRKAQNIYLYSQKPKDASPEKDRNKETPPPILVPEIDLDDPVDKKSLDIKIVENKTEVCDKLGTQVVISEIDITESDSNESSEKCAAEKEISDSDSTLSKMFQDSSPTKKTDDLSFESKQSSSKSLGNSPKSKSTEDLLCSSVSFESFCQKVVDVDLTDTEQGDVKKRKQPETEIVIDDDDEDVIFVGIESSPNVVCSQVSKKMKFSNDAGPVPERNSDNFVLLAAPYMDQQRLICMPCVATFQNLDLLMWHMSAHFSWFRYQCAKCTFVTFNHNDCLVHLIQEHNLVELEASTFILPLPNWKTLLMSHDFRSLKDSQSFGGKHTNENINLEIIEESEPVDNESVASDSRDSDVILFGEVPKIAEDQPKDVPDIKEARKLRRCTIDLHDGKSGNDFQILPEPIELRMPADISDVIKTLDSDASSDSVERTSPVSVICDESNDDWVLVQTRTNEDQVDDEHDVDDSKVSISNVRPCRTRTKVKNKDFVYYDQDINNVLKIK